MLRRYDVLDSLPEEQYDDLVHLAAMVCGAPVAAISLLDEGRQWFKAKVGIELSETPRDQSFCAHAVLEPDELLEVADATADPRFAANPLVLAEDGIRFYAGTPLLGEDDQPLGALCVIDSRPRTLTDHQRTALEALGRQVVGQLELRRRLLEAERAEQRVRESEARYRHLARHDALTGLANRSAFHARLTVHAGRRLGLCYVDLDRFKQVNDEHGHEAGDAVLVQVAQALRSVCPPDAVVARLGGDEFVVLCPDADEWTVQRQAARIVEAVERPVRLPSGGHVVVGASAGWTVAGAEVAPDEALRRADRAMYDAKAARRRGTVPQVPAGDPAADLRRALDENQLLVEYQPFCAVRADRGRLEARVTGAEALVRWQHPVHGLVAPSQFVPLAERTGLIAELGRQVLETAVGQTAAWDRAGLLPDGFRMHVNLVAQQLHTGQVLESVAGALASAALAPQRLCLEITESGLLDAQEFTPEAARAFTDLGVHLALDDFGTGFSSLTQLRTYPFDVLKVDRSFVSGLGVSTDDEAIVEAVVRLADRLGIRAVAEGVETLDQLRRLLALGCAGMQGYLLGRPSPPGCWETAVLRRGWRVVPGQGPRMPAPRRTREELEAAS